MASGDTNYYIRVRGRVRGPYNMARLKLLHARGQLSRVHQVSTDGQAWVSASTLGQVFTVKPQVVEPQVVQSAGVEREATQWYYQKDEQSHGPVSDDQLQAMIMRGELSGDDPVCEVGATQWSTVDSIFSSSEEQEATNGKFPWTIVGLGLLAMVFIAVLVVIGVIAAIYFWPT